MSSHSQSGPVEIDELQGILTSPPQTFLGLPAVRRFNSGAAVIFGASHGTPYTSPLYQPTEEQGPDAVRRAITEASIALDHWDFDFGGPLLSGNFQAIDIGNAVTDPREPQTNFQTISKIAEHLSAAGCTPILIGGDDSTAIPFMRAIASAHGVLHVLQIDAHIDWRDDINGEKLGYSSTMRRASELPSVRSMTQIGIRATGSARKEEVEAAISWGSSLVTVSELRRAGIEAIIDRIPRGGPILIHIDCDGLDPAICPGVNAPSPGGLSYSEMTSIIALAMSGRQLAGFSIVEFQPRADQNDISATVVGRLISHVLGHLARA
jgi:agmatinase